MIADSINILSTDTLNTNGYDLDISGTLTVSGTFDATDDVETDETSVAVGRDFIVNSGAMFSADQSTIHNGWNDWNV